MQNLKVHARSILAAIASIVHLQSIQLGLKLGGNLSDAMGRCYTRVATVLHVSVGVQHSKKYDQVRVGIYLFGGGALFPIPT